MEAAPQLPRKPVARTEKVEDLVEMVWRGKVRVPSFQRGLKWEAKHVQELFDSIYRGYPVGSLLFYCRPAEAARVRVGPLPINAPEENDAWWVVDGQQRLTALTACLKRPVPLPTRPDTSDPYVLYFDVEDQVFRTPPRDGDPPASWVPLPKLLYGSDLTEWAFTWEHGKDEALRRRLFEAGARIREYPIPLYLIETDDVGAARQIFYRTNQAGRPLEWPEVFKALFGEGRFSPATLGDLAGELEKLGMGRLSEERLLTALFGLRGLDPTRTLDEHYRRNPSVLENAVRDGVSVLEEVLRFLRRDCKIPHLRLLPKPILLDVLSRFFALHPSPSARTRTLLSRWFWRIVLGAGAFDDRTLRRRGIRSIREDDEEASVQSLLALVDPKRARPFELPSIFDGRSDDNRIVLATLAHFRPLDLQTGEPLDVGALIEEQGDRAFVKIVKQASVEGARSAANRILQPKGTPVMRLLRQHQAAPEFRNTIAPSHSLSSKSLDLLGDGDLDEFVAVRGETLTEAVRHFASRMAAWEHSDRPSIEYLLRAAEAVAS
ncbi:MAG TPA: DUF262 domain-containing protein [Thermoanaerobaculia bacterium]|nr:DUF262 domain-containing protein [Thermoanaerobaculia bacterium]